MFKLEETAERAEIALDFVSKNWGTRWDEVTARDFFSQLGVPEEELLKIQDGHPLPSWYKDADWLRRILNV